MSVYKWFVIGIILGCSTKSGKGETDSVTNEVEMTFRVPDYHGSGKPENVTMRYGLFGDAAPMTVLNFISLCKGYSKKGTKLQYVDTPIHRIVPDFVIQMGDVVNRDGSGGMSIFGKFFDDEHFHLSHRGPGWLAMANNGKDSNGSQFYITLVKARWLDKKHVVFGKVITGMDNLYEIGETKASSTTGQPFKKIKIVKCEEIQLERKWTMSEEQMYADHDVKDEL